jgi:hypothetical protein
MIGAYYRASDNAAGATGYLLIVAFDIVLATIVVPLFGCFYAVKPSPRAASCSGVAGALTRIILEFALPKDGYLLLPFASPEFENYGGAASTKLPLFFDAEPEYIWDPTVEVCQQELYRDFTGVDSLSAFLLSVIVFCTVQFLEFCLQRPLFNLPGLIPYLKPGQDEEPQEPVIKEFGQSESEITSGVVDPSGRTEGAQHGGNENGESSGNDSTTDNQTPGKEIDSEESSSELHA